jgi:hypothetical protein
MVDNGMKASGNGSRCGRDADEGAAPPPAHLVEASALGTTRRLWPFTGNDFGTQRADPINLIFVGEAHPLALRAALLALDGDRTAHGFPALAPFDCTWADSIGEEQTAYTDDRGWAGSVVQLACGPYDAVRVHLRLFAMGEWTLANAHVDVLIPGTPHHQVVSWEAAERLVVADFVRSGLLATPPSPTGPLHEAPFRTIPAAFYNALPPDLRRLAGGPAEDVSADVPIRTGGTASVLHLARSVAPVPGDFVERLTIRFDKAIPKPFCNPGAHWVRVQGPIHLTQTVCVTASGAFSRRLEARGEVAVTPVDPRTGRTHGLIRVGQVHEQTHARLDADGAQLRHRRLLELEAGPRGPERLEVELRVGPDGATGFHHGERCASAATA